MRRPLLLLVVSATLLGLGCKDREKEALRGRAERQERQLRRAAEELDRAKASLDRLELRLSLAQADVRKADQVLEHTAAARASLGEVRKTLQDAQEALR